MNTSIWNHQNLTQIAAANNGKLALNCDMCGLEFRRYACHAKRTTNHFCGPGCRDAFKSLIGHVDHPCPICGTPSKQTLSDAARDQTCSPSCGTIKRQLTAELNLPTDHLTKSLPMNVVAAVLNSTESYSNIVVGTGLSYGQVHRIKTERYVQAKVKMLHALEVKRAITKVNT